MNYSEQQAAITKAREFCAENGINYDSASFGYSKNGKELNVYENDNSITVTVAAHDAAHVNTAEFGKCRTKFRYNGARSSKTSFIADLKNL